MEEVLDPDHVEEHRPERDAELEFGEGQVNLAAIAAKLHLPVSEFRSWAEDEMIFIQYGDNLSEGIAGEGATCLSATANFFCRWYEDIILKQGVILLCDDRYLRYDRQGEQRQVGAQIPRP